MTTSHESTGFSIPTHWDLNTLERIYELKLKAEENRTKNINVTMYGAIPESTFGTGRISSVLPSVSEKNAKKYIQRVHELGFQFRYLFNPRNILTKENRDSVHDSIRKVIEDFEIAHLTIAQKEILDFVQEKYPTVSVTISTIAGVQEPKQIIEYAQYDNVKRITVHHDLNRNIPLLRQCIDTATANKIALELMVTENCVYQCPIRDIHYAALGRRTTPQRKIDEYQIPCWIDKLRNPEEIIEASWITPEGIQLYKSIGVQEFKITGRDKKSERLPLIVESYFNQSFDGNIMRLLGTAPQPVAGRTVEAEDMVFLDANSLHGFYERLEDSLNKGIPYKEFCKGVTTELFQQGKLRLNSEEYSRQMLEYIQDTKVYQLWNKARTPEE